MHGVVAGIGAGEYAILSLGALERGGWSASLLCGAPSAWGGDGLVTAELSVPVPSDSPTTTLFPSASDVQRGEALVHHH